MKTKKILGCLAALAITLQASAQVAWDTNGNTVTGVSEWFGADASSTAPLRIETRVNQPIDWYTSAIQRMQLNETVSTLVSPVFGFGGITWKTGFLGLSGRPGFFTASPGPFSRLHLVDDVGADDPIVYAQIFGYRPWMRNGITFTGNSDQGYIGHKYVGDDNTDFVIQWSEDASAWL